jgi:glycosyltransferase involved in cell wall biosynthesis
MPEVAGDAALLIDPDSDDSLAEGLITLLSDGHLRAELGQAGRQRAQAYSWQRTAELTAEVYRRVLGE